MPRKSRVCSPRPPPKRNRRRMSCRLVVDSTFCWHRLRRLYERPVLSVTVKHKETCSTNGMWNVLESVASFVAKKVIVFGKLVEMFAGTCKSATVTVCSSAHIARLVQRSVVWPWSGCASFKCQHWSAFTQLWIEMSDQAHMFVCLLRQGSANTFWRDRKDSSKFSRPKKFSWAYILWKIIYSKYQF